MVVVGKPGSGKTVSLKFIALMLATGETGVIRLRLDKAYVPLYVRLADYADKLKDDPTLALETFLLDFIGKNYPGANRQGEFLQTALNRGECMVLLDGLDEVGDIGDSLLHGKTLRSSVVDQVQRFSNRRCSDYCRNRIIVSSRLEGYQPGNLSNFDEMELAALSVPDEVQDFLLRWFIAYEQGYHPELARDVALRKAQGRVESLMNDIMRSESVQRLAMNPLLLTILAMIHEMGTRLPNERVKLYETVARTMIENWRLAQTRHVSSIYDVLPASRIMPLMASLAYWLHENQPGGAMPEADWRIEIERLLRGDDKDDKDDKDDINQKEVDELVDLFLRHAREEVGLLTERSPGQIGFFHLTLEEYLAAFEIARQETDQRREMVAKHWANPRWQEVILLTAGQLMLNASMALDTFINDLRTQDDHREPELVGRPALLAGLALIDVGREHFRRKVVQDVRDDLLELAQNLDFQTKQPVTDERVPSLTRAAAADALDELGYIPEDLYNFVQIDNFWIAKYPITNLQYERFLRSENFKNKSLWSGFPKFSEPDKDREVERLGDWEEEGWNWLQKELKSAGNHVHAGILLPRYWRDPRFGITRKTVPVVGITWYEANAYCKWLLTNWDELQEGKLGVEKPSEIRLPTEAEWENAAGGTASPSPSQGEGRGEGRFAWDKPGEVTPKEKVTLFANINESGINRTSPVLMYLQGASHPHKLMDVSGNVWEWQANYYSDSHQTLGLRGGSWSSNVGNARVSGRLDALPYNRWNDFGFRVVVVFPPI